MSDELADRQIFLTGGTGFLGRHLAPALKEAAGHVDALVRSERKARSALPAGLTWHVGDMTDPDSWPARALAEADLIVHLANVVGFEERRLQRVNVEGTRQLARRAAATGTERFLYVSSVAVYGFDAPEVVTETTSYGHEAGPYGRSKQEAEAALLEESRDANLDPVIVQPSAVYGPYDQTWTMGSFEMARDGPAILPDGEEALIHFLYVTDAIDGLMVALRRGAPAERYILSGPEVVTVKKNLEYYLAMTGGGPVRSIPGWLMSGLAGTLEHLAPLIGTEPPLTREELRHLRRHSRYSHKKAARELGFDPQVGMEEGIARVQAWLEEEGWLDPAT